MTKAKERLTAAIYDEARATGHAPGAAQIGDNSEIEVDEGLLLDTIESLATSQKTISEATGSLRSKIKAVLDDTGWHNGALGTIRSIAAMSETKRADYLRTFRPMLRIMCEVAWDAEARDLLGGQDEIRKDAADFDSAMDAAQ